MNLKILVILLLIISTNLNATAMTPAVEDILRQTMATDGYLTHEMHQKFWTEIRSHSDKKEIDLIINTLNLNILIAQEYQKELWASANISYINKQVVKTERLIQLENELPLMFEKTLHFPKGSPNYKQAMLAYNNQMEVSFDNSARLLNSAAARSSMTSAQGQHIPLDINMINTVLTNLKSSFTRIKNLFNENWSDQQK